MAATVAEEVRERRKPGIYEENGMLIVKGEEYILRIANALASPTRLKILRLLSKMEADVGEVAELLGQSKANASAQIRRLEEVGLVKTEYKPGVRGVRKVCKAPYKRILLVLED